MRSPATKSILFFVMSVLQSGCDDATVKACFGSTSFCESVFSRNSAPIANAGNDQEVAGGDSVTLDGSSSRDADGRIDSFSWVQTQGQTVALRDANSPLASFDAPTVGDQTMLVFQLTVVDDLQAADQDSVVVRILPRTAYAIRAGLDMLNRSLPPSPVQAIEPCEGAMQPSDQGWFAYAGAWLAVVGKSLGHGSTHTDVTPYLDAARVLLARAEEGEVTNTVAVTLWQHGLEELQRFAGGRDPALSEWASSMRTLNLDVKIISGLYGGKTTLRLNSPDEPVLVTVGRATPGNANLKYLAGLSCTGEPDPLRVASALMRLQADEEDH